MALFKSIMDKLGMGHDDKDEKAQQAQGTQSGNLAHASEKEVSAPEGSTSAQVTNPADAPAPALSGASATTTAPTTAPSAAPALSRVDVTEKLDSMAASHPEQLNWRSSIVDLLKLIGMDSSLSARKDLAIELGCPESKMNDSAQMNIWLHRTVLQKLADNGGNVPADLLS